MAESKYTKGVLAKLTVTELKSTADDEGIDWAEDGLVTKAQLIEALLEVEVEDEEELEEEEVDEPEVEEDDLEEEIEADEVDEPTPAPAKKTRAAKPKEAATDGEGVVAAKQVATLLGTEAKTLRQFFRSSASTVEPVGSGGRYEFDEADVPQIKAEFDAWKAGHASRGAKRGTGTGTPRKRGPKVAEVTEVEEVEELEIEELEDEELDGDDLELEEEV